YHPGADITYRDWRESILLWEGWTTLKPEQIGSAVAMQLGGECRKLANKVFVDLVFRGRVFLRFSHGSLSFGYDC
ncbi:MAG: hypothetical protein QGG84_11625, partial [Rhodospirillales bacterium]|nr:hypothetical protein [Rhodospirillales bacterium]